MATIQSLPVPPDELEQEAMLRTLRRLVVALEVRARSAAIRLNDEWKERVAEHTRKVVAQGNGPLPEEYRGIHYGLALALIDRLKPYYEEIAFKKKDALRKTRGIDNALESALLILLSEDCDFDEVAWGFHALGPWGSAFVERSKEYCEKYGWPSLPDHRAMIRVFGTSGFFSGTGRWEVRYALVWKMAQRVINTLEAAAMSTNSAANPAAGVASVVASATEPMRTEGPEIRSEVPDKLEPKIDAIIGLLARGLPGIAAGAQAHETQVAEMPSSTPEEASKLGPTVVAEQAQRSVTESFADGQPSPAETSSGDSRDGERIAAQWEKLWRQLSKTERAILVVLLERGRPWMNIADIATKVRRTSRTVETCGKRLKKLELIASDMKLGYQLIAGGREMAEFLSREAQERAAAEREARSSRRSSRRS
jgi:hypothetical protein